MSTFLKTVFTPRSTTLLLLLYVFLLYLFSFFQNLQVLVWFFSSSLSLSILWSQVITLPVQVYLNATATSFTLFLFNIFLISLYVVLLVHALAARSNMITKGTSSGIFGSLFALLGVGCAACGSLLTPLIIYIGVSVPLAMIAHLDVIISISASATLLIAVFLLGRRIHLKVCKL